LVQWKGEVKPGTVVQDPCFSLDIFPTILDIAGIPKDKAKPGLEGQSLVPLLEGSSSSAKPRAIFWRMGAQRAVRFGDWKMVVRRGSSPELYDLKDDIAESKNLADSKPDELAELQKLYTDWDKKNIAPLWRRNEGGD
jgi:arylsulfatase A-like enzyme